MIGCLIRGKGAQCTIFAWKPRIYSKPNSSFRERTLPPGCQTPTAMKTGINRQRQINCYDPDGTRVEFMEPNTVDGRPAPSSKAPPPQ